jgi:hypothetical protein
MPVAQRAGVVQLQSPTRLFESGSQRTGVGGQVLGFEGASRKQERTILGFQRHQGGESGAGR